MMLGKYTQLIHVIAGAIKYIPKSFWKYVGWFLILIGIGMMFSFILRGSIKIERVKSHDKNTTEETFELEQHPLPGTKLTIIKDGKKVSIKKGPEEEEEKPNE